MKLIALKDFTPDGVRRLKAGEVFEISDKSSHILIATKRAKPVDKPVEKPSDEEKPKKGQYSRRDMRAAS